MRIRVLDLSQCARTKGRVAALGLSSPGIGLWGRGMWDAKALRSRAVRLLLMAIGAQHRGAVAAAEQLTARAADYLDKAVTMEVQDEPAVEPDGSSPRRTGLDSGGA